jgi:hypothetical protein
MSTYTETFRQMQPSHDPRHIARCVNLHDELVAALEAMMAGSKVGTDGRWDCVVMPRDAALNAARAALAKAKEGA